MDNNNYEDAPGDGVNEVRQPSTISNPDDAGVAGAHTIDCSNSGPIWPFTTTRCTGYGSRGSCSPDAAVVRATWGTSEYQRNQPLCPGCCREFLADLDRWKSEQFDEEQ
jgi:hypothetical protein